MFSALRINWNKVTADGYSRLWHCLLCVVLVLLPLAGIVGRLNSTAPISCFSIMGLVVAACLWAVAVGCSISFLRQAERLRALNCGLNEEARMSFTGFVLAGLGTLVAALFTTTYFGYSLSIYTFGQVSVRDYVLVVNGQVHPGAFVWPSQKVAVVPTKLEVSAIKVSFPTKDGEVSGSVSGDFLVRPGYITQVASEADPLNGMPARLQAAVQAATKDALADSYTDDVTTWSGTYISEKIANRLSKTLPKEFDWDPDRPGFSAGFTKVYHNENK